MDRLLNTKQVARILGVRKLETVYGYIASGQLKAHKLGGNSKSKRHWRIKPKDLEAFVEGRTLRKGQGAEAEHAESSKE